MALSKKAAAAKKAAATRAAKKEQAAVAQEQEPEQRQVSETQDETAETGASTSTARMATVKEEVKESAAPAKAARTSKRGKKAEAVQDEEDVKPTLDAPVKDEPIQSTPADNNTPDVKAEAPAPASNPVDDTPATATSIPSTSVNAGVSMESRTAAPASEAGAPDIAGVIEEREDTDLVMDDTEPPPMDSEEVKRLRERPTETRDTSDAMPVFQGSGGMAQVQQEQAVGLKEAVDAQGGRPVGEQVGIQQPGETGRDMDLDAEPSTSTSGNSTKEDRMAKMNALRKRMNDSAQANRKEVIAAQNEHRKNIAESKRLERKRKQAEAMGEKLDALETGEDLERKRNWEYTLEDNEKWTKKQDRKDRRADHGFKDYDDSARRKYKRDIDAFKPDLQNYRSQREAAIANGLAIEAGPSGTQGSSMDMIHGSSSGAMIPGGDQLFRDANSFVYADHRPSEDAIDKVVGQINQDIDKRAKRSRVRKEEDEDITYINDKNKSFNKKLERYFNKYTTEIKQNFERGTAL